MVRAVRLAAATLLVALVAPATAGVVGRLVSHPALAATVRTGGGCGPARPSCGHDVPAASTVSLHVAVGYRDQYRMSAWVPIRVTAENAGTAAVAGVVIIPDRGVVSQYASAEYSSLYQAPLTVQPRSTRQVTLYVPGQDVNGAVSVQMRLGGRVLATATDAPSVFDDSAITVGTLTNDPFASAWLRTVRPQNATLALSPLSVRTLDTVPESLANFDVIVVTNIDVSRLSRQQDRSLQEYVQDGGSLLLVGGPDWQETLGALPAALVPGALNGSRALPDLSGLRSVVGEAPARQETVVSLLDHPRGWVEADQNGVPLVVCDDVGRGRILYLAFDPAIDPIARWAGATSLLTELMKQVGPHVGVRLAINSGTISGGLGFRFGPSSMERELANVPAAMEPALQDLLLVIALAILILGPLNFLILTALGKRELAWILLPALAILLLSSTVFTASRLKGSLALVNTASVIELDGRTSQHPTTVYAALFAPISDTYRMVWDGPGLIEGAPEYGFTAAYPPQALPVGVRLDEGAKTLVTFPSMRMWSTRSVAINTTVTVPGTVDGQLRVAPDGAIVGMVRNGTNLTLRACAIVAGDAYLRLPNLRPGGMHSVRLLPRADLNTEDLPLVWDQVYGSASQSSLFGAWDGDPWEEPVPAKEVSFVDRVRNLSERLPEAQDISSLGEVLFAGWSDRPLGRLTVDGAAPRRRDLSLLVSKLSVHFARGSFRLRPGTLGATLLDVVPATPADGCCPSPMARQPIDLGPGGSATFQFDIPDAARVHFGRLEVAINAGGADWSEIGQAYDWQQRRWVHVDVPPSGAALHDPARFISPGGALLVRLHATGQTGDIVINDPDQDIQLSGRGIVR